MRNIYFVVMFFCLWFYKSYSQSNSSTPAINVVPSSPNSAALGKYGDVPIGMFTGTVGLQVPLFSFNTQNLSVPISLSYNSNGIKVDDMPSKVGMGWVVNAGGVISRTKYDKFDDVTTPKASAPPTSNPNFNPGNGNYDPALISWLENIVTNELDTQLDEFNFNFGGYSGKFILNENYDPVLVSYGNLKIENNKTWTSFSGTPQSWKFKVTTPDGTVYYFGENNAYESSTPTTGCGWKSNGDFGPSAWYLTKIQHPYNQSDIITFTYTTSGYSYATSISDTYSYYDPESQCGKITNQTSYGETECSCGPTPCVSGKEGRLSDGQHFFCVNNLSITGVYLKEINSALYGKVKFTYLDKSNLGIKDVLVGKIEYFKPENLSLPLKTFDLVYDYSLGNDSYTNTYMGLSRYGGRAFLKTVTEQGENLTFPKKYSFEYEDINGMPPRLSFAQDHWGYFNGKVNYNTFIPYDSHSQIQVTKNVEVADRNPDISFAIKGILTKVIYPTGGSSQFIYEAHTNSNGVVTIGGLRVKKVIATDAITSITQVKKYNYGEGIIPNSPIYFTKETHKRQWHNYSNVFFENECKILNCDNPLIECSYLTFHANSLINSVGRGNALVYYSNITESFGENYENGGIEHVFQSEIANNFTILRGSPIYSISAPNFSWKVGQEVNTNYFKLVNGNRTYTKKVANVYTSDTRVNQEFVQYGIRRNDVVIGNDNTNCAAVNSQTIFDYRMGAFDVISYKTKVEWFYLSSTTTQDYGTDNSNPIVTTVNYYYDNKDHALLTRTETTSSKGENLKQVNKYVGDESNISNLTTTETNAIPLLKTQYRIGTLLEREEYRNNTLLSRNRTGFKDWGNNIILPENVKIQIGSGPLETRLTYQNYDDKGNIISYSKDDNVATSYIWGYDQRFPIAEVKNAALTSTTQSTQIASITGSNLPATSNRYINTTNGFTLNQAQPVQFNISVSSTKQSNISGLNLLVMSGSSILATIPLTTYPVSNTAILSMNAGNYNLNYSLILYDPLVDIPTVSLSVQVNGQITNSNVFHTSFESGFPGVTGITAKTGKNCYNGIFSLSPPPNAGKYRLSYWQKANESSPWTFVEQIINQTSNATYSALPIQVGNGGYIDEVRLHPIGSLMFTYTYDPLIGMTSSTDANNVTAYYEYDAFQRLKLVRDQDKKIIKNYQYHYQGQTP